MAFQDFEQLTQRRRTSNEQKFRRRVMIAVASGVALLVIVGAGVFAVVSHVGAKKESAEAGQSPPGADKIDNVIRFICNGTDYKNKCEQTLTKSASGATASPREFLLTAISAAKTELREAFNKTSTWKFANPLEKGAFEDCQGLVEDALEELEDAVKAVGGSGSGMGTGTGPAISEKAPDLDSWLSAVISYQQTCIDGFPPGKTKDAMAKLFQASKEFTSNSLALVTEVAALLSAFQFTAPTPPRHLLEKAETAVAPAPGPARAAVFSKKPALIRGSVAAPGPAPIRHGRRQGLAPKMAPELELELGPSSSAVGFDDLGFPSWMEEEDRRMLKMSDEKPTPNVTVAQDGSGQFKTINEALAVIPLKSTERFVIYVKEGIYNETVILTKKMWNITMYGDGSQKSIITGNKNYIDGVRTFLTASFAALGDGFFGKSMGFRNTAGPEKHQAVAARIQSDRAIFVNCRFEGYQDTLYTQTHRQFYRSCVISGTVDFIFGDAAVVFQNCLIVIRRPLDNQQNIVTAQGRSDNQQTTGIVLHSCRIQADKKLEPVKNRLKSYLGRPWKEFSRTVIMESTIQDVIQPEGWLPWLGTFALDTLYYGEYRNKGPGASVEKRVNWRGYNKALPKEEALQFTVENFLPGTWLSDIKGVPIQYTLYDES